jgi:hypothetical protein
MYANRIMKSVEIFQRSGGGEIRENSGGSELN